MRFLNFLALTLVVVLGFSSCKPDGGDNHEHSSDLVGTWTCIQANFAEALVINEDGSVVSTGVEDGEYWENVAGKIVAENGKVTMTFEDNDNFEGHFDIIPGIAFSIYTDNGERYTYNYCAEDLSEEIIGMWVCTGNGTNVQGIDDMVVQTYRNDGTALFTGTALPNTTGATMPNTDGYMLNSESTYKVVGDLLIRKGNRYVAMKLNYTPDGTTLGDIMTTTTYLVVENNVINATSSYLRIKQSLDFSNNMKYEYSNIYVTNVKGKDVNFEFAGHTFNFSTLDGTFMDNMMKNILFNVSFPTVDKISYNCYYDGANKSVDAPIVVEGNKVTIKMSANNAVYKDVDIYAFQDVDACQLHMYMPTSSFTKFFANICAVGLAKKGELDLNDANAVAELYNKIDAAIETINVSFIFKAEDRSL